MTKNRFEIVKSKLIKDGWVISDKLKQFTFPTLRGDKRALFSYCKALNELSKENERLKSKGLKVLEFYEYKLKNTDSEEFENAREELWIVKEMLYEMGVIKNE